MKKYLMMCALGGLFLASCTSEDVLSPQDVAQNSKETPMSFNVRAANQSRDALNTLNTVHNNFGVWAMKVKDDVLLSSTTFTDRTTDPITSPSTNVIMENYLVGYNADGAYNKATIPSSTWGYEGLGNTEYTENGYTHSNNAKQYLKYWDGSFTNTWFVAYSPYINGATTPTLAIVEGNPVLTFPNTLDAYATNGYSDLMFAIQNCTNSTYLADDQTVSLTFKRFGARLQIALWEDIDGYSVTMDDVYFNNEESEGESEPVTYAYAIPFDMNGTSYERGSYASGGKPTVTWDVSEEGYPAAVSFTDASTSSANLIFDLGHLATGAPDPNGTETVIGDSDSEKVYSSTTHSVNPGTSNSGLQFVFNFTLHSEDTAETIKVTNARVDVPSTYTNWNSSTLYTYIFKITKNATGNTTGSAGANDPETPAVHALYPIVFDNITVVDETDGAEHTFDVNEEPATEP